MGHHRSTRSRLRSRRGQIAALAAGGLVFSLAGVQISNASERDVPGAPIAAAPAVGVLDADAPNALDDSYVVILRDGVVTTSEVRPLADRLAARHGGTVKRAWGTALLGFEASMSRAAAERLATEPAVDYVEQNRVLGIAETQDDPPSFGLDRIDQEDGPTDDEFTFPNTASNVRAYIIDTGIRLSHEDFDGRAESGFDVIDGGAGEDCSGHGTHVAGTVGGSEFGVAKEVNLVAVRVLDCEGLGSTAEVIAGVNFVTRDAEAPAVANMSIGGGNGSRALDQAVRNSIEAGVTYVVAAGNADENACGTSPGRLEEAVTVGATDRDDERASFSNFGPCLDIFAPGVGITSAFGRSDTATRTLSGTSMAAPHVAGAAALVLADNPDFSPEQVSQALLDAASTGVVGDDDSNSPDLFLRING